MHECTHTHTEIHKLQGQNIPDHQAPPSPITSMTGLQSKLSLKRRRDSRTLIHLERVAVCLYALLNINLTASVQHKQSQHQPSPNPVQKLNMTGQA